MKKEKKVTTGDFIETQNKPVEKQKDVKKAKKSTRPGFFKRIGMKMKDVFSELKKVAWPKFPKVVKQTGVVFAVVIVFLVVITAFDFGLMELLKLIAPRG